MKKLSIITVAALLAFFATSCFDSDTSTLTEEEVEYYTQLIAGNYSGRLIFNETDSNGNTLYEEGSAVIDTVEVSWVVNTDGTMTVSGIPAYLFALATSDESLKEAMQKAEQQPLAISYSFYYSGSYPSFLLNPDSVKYDFVLDGEERSAIASFYLYSAYSWGYYISASSLMVFQIVQAGLYLDDSSYEGGYGYNVLTEEKAFAFSSTTKL